MEKITVHLTTHAWIFPLRVCELWRCLLIYRLTGWSSSLPTGSGRSPSGGLLPMVLRRLLPWQRMRSLSRAMSDAFWMTNWSYVRSPMSSAPCRKRCTLHSSFCCNDSLRWVLCLASQPRTTETKERDENRDIRCVRWDKQILKEYFCSWFAILDITFLTGDDLFMKLVTAVIELVCLPVSQKHFTAAHLHTKCNMYSD